MLTDLSLNILRAFDAAARHGSFTQAGKELCVTQAAVSHQVKALEHYLGKPVFRRTSRGLVLTDEGAMIAPVVEETLGRVSQILTAVKSGAPTQILTLGVVGTFAIGFLLERLPGFRAANPHIELRLMTHNNKPDPMDSSLDCNIRFGDGTWPGMKGVRIMNARLSALCSPIIAGQLRHVGDLGKFTLLRSFRSQDWPRWLNAAGFNGAAGVNTVSVRGPMFDSSTTMVQAAMMGEGVALAPPAMFARQLREERLSQPFALEIDVGSYYLLRSSGREVGPEFIVFRDWLLRETGKCLL